ncbi:short chain oxidoreductase [Paxillus ammoniavirescens]|nr:short chain oxidoreductase [Paxillus ammoniavirescens]
MSISKGIALITGSAQGIGRGIALRLAKDGYDIALNDIPSKHNLLRAVADDIDKSGQKTLVLPADVTVEGQVKGMVQEVTKELGGLDVVSIGIPARMVANAGVGQLSPLTSTGLGDWERIMAVNARGPFLCYKHAAEQMIKQGRGGRIIGASSLAGKTGLPLASAYCASKFAVKGLTQTAALELGRYGITFNAYAPGAIQTPMTMNITSEDIKTLSSDQESAGWIMSHLEGRPIKRNGQPEDIASIASYLVSKDGHFITGQTISVDGGVCMT